MLCSREPLFRPEQNKQRHMVGDAVMVCVDNNAFPNVGCLVRFLTVFNLAHAGVGEVHASVDDLRCLSPIACEGSATFLRRTISQLAKPVEHHSEVRISIVLRALEAQDGVRRGNILGNVVADGHRSNGGVCGAGLLAVLVAC